jgi:hypothetical protein
MVPRCTLTAPHRPCSGSRALTNNGCQAETLTPPPFRGLCRTYCLLLDP